MILGVQKKYMHLDAPEQPITVPARGDRERLVLGVVRGGSMVPTARTLNLEMVFYAPKSRLLMRKSLTR